MSDKSDLAVDWQNDDDTLTLKQPVIPSINREDFASFKAFNEANNASWRSPTRLAQARAARTYVLAVEQDGSFRAEDVPPGTYELKLKVTRADANRRSPISTDSAEELGSVTREVVVPPGNGPFDLGTLIVPMKGGGGGTTKSSLASRRSVQKWMGFAMAFSVQAVSELRPCRPHCPQATPHEPQGPLMD